jgi:hypothetical protein
MDLPVNPPILPMLSKRIGELPASGTWIFEPKWDGFRALIFRDGDEVLIQSRDRKSLNRYFPELLDPLRSQLPTRCVLDGEIVIAKNGALDFEALQLRIHPAASRVKLLSKEIPASIVFFDLLCEGSRSNADAGSWNRSLLPQCHRSILRRPPTTEMLRRTGLAASKARVSTELWPNHLQGRTSRTSVRCLRSNMSAIAIASWRGFDGTKGRSTPP